MPLLIERTHVCVWQLIHYFYYYSALGARVYRFARLYCQCIFYIYFYFPFWVFSPLLTHLLIAFTIHTQFALETTYTIFSYFAAEHIEMQQHCGRK